MYNTIICNSTICILICLDFLAFMKDYNQAIMYYYNWLKNKNLTIDHALNIISLYESALNGMSHYLIKLIAKVDVFLIIVSIILSIQARKSIKNILI